MMEHVGAVGFHEDEEEDDDQDFDVYCWICGDEGHSPSERCQRDAGMI
ncbi:hypothetical protein ACFY4C_42120 [Actinomadura viridis]